MKNRNLKYLHSVSTVPPESPPVELKALVKFTGINISIAIINLYKRTEERRIFPINGHKNNVIYIVFTIQSTNNKVVVHAIMYHPLY